MPTLARIDRLIIAINGKPREHAPPHFHVSGPNVDFTVRLDNLQILAGEYDRKAFASAVAWANENMDRLWTMWRDLND